MSRVIHAQCCVNCKDTLPAHCKPSSFLTVAALCWRFTAFILAVRRRQRWAQRAVVDMRAALTGALLALLACIRVHGVTFELHSRVRWVHSNVDSRFCVPHHALDFVLFTGGTSCATHACNTFTRAKKEHRYSQESTVPNSLVPWSR